MIMMMMMMMMMVVVVLVVGGDDDDGDHDVVVMMVVMMVMMVVIMSRLGKVRECASRYKALTATLLTSYTYCNANNFYTTKRLTANT